MAELYRQRWSGRYQRVILVGIILPSDPLDGEDPLEELRSLVRTAGAEVVGEMVVRRNNVHPGLFVGTGKAREIARYAESLNADLVVFDTDLSPAQIRELERIISRRVLDRSEVILDIFARHARSRQAGLQVELAQLEYTYPRLSHMWTHLGRVAGRAGTPAAAVGGIGTRGPGEKQIEIDRRLVRKRITQLKRKLAAIDKQRQRAVAKRREHFLVCLVGYTNAGKSSLMNLLTSAGVSVADKLFETLDTRTRRWKITASQVALLSDTVGFISRLPHHLIAAFRATLEEVVGADLLLHVADASHRQVDQHIQAVGKVLHEIGCSQKDQVLLLNKIDKIVDPTVRTILANKYPHAIFVSAVTGEGADRVTRTVLEKMRGREVNITIEADYTNGRLMQYLAHHARSLGRSFHHQRIRMTATIGKEHLAVLRRFGEDVMILSPSEREGQE